LLGHQYRYDKNRTSPWYIIVKTLNIENKETILRIAREKCQIIYNSKPIIITADFSIENLKAKRAWNAVFQTLKQNNFNLVLLCLTKLSFIIEGEIKTFHAKQKQKRFMATKPVLQKILIEPTYK
jgi:hypothetical protein